MDIRKLQRAIVDGLEDVKAQDIVVFNTEKLSPLFERVIIASGTSNRQTKALASSVRETVKKRGMPVMATEGEDNGEWIIVDCGAAVAHIMQPAIRDYYHLEEIWGGKAVRLKTAETRALPKAEEPAAGPAAKKAPATKKAATAGARAATPSTERPAGRSAGAGTVQAARKSTGKSTGKGTGKGAARSTARSTEEGSRKGAGKAAGKPAAKAPSRQSTPARKAAAPRKSASPRKLASPRKPART